MEKNSKRYVALTFLAKYPNGACAKQIVEENEKDLQNNGFNTRGKDGKLITNSFNATLASMCENSTNTNKEKIFVCKKAKGAIYKDNVYTLYTINENGKHQIEEN